MSINAMTVKLLRDKTGVSIMQCKQALEESAGDMEKAIEILRKQGVATAAKKAARVAKDGLIMCRVSEGIAGIVEINSETDFVARNEDFKAYVENVLEIIIENQPSDVDSLFNLKLSALDGKSVRDLHLEKISAIRENLIIRRFKLIKYQKNKERIFSYIHAGGKIGVLLLLSVTHEEVLEKAEFHELGKNLAMQIAAANPIYKVKEQVSKEVLEKEREINRELALKEGKPEKIIEKVIDGRINKWFQDVCLIEQEYIREPKMRVKDILSAASRAMGTNIDINEFVRFQLGVE